MHLLDTSTASTVPGNMSNPDQTQEEHEHISTSLAIEQIDTNLFRSTSLWRPVRARSAFGGQVISQAVVSATNCTDPAFALHVCNHADGKLR
jgi:acyl-CoA thioesterase